LSGGQRQRIAIARALFTNPRILILDEATSALDYESEAILQRNMAHICQGRTVIIIAHRLSAVRNAHRIIVMDKGQIVESGAHDALVQKPGGLYAHLWAMQDGGQPRTDCSKSAWNCSSSGSFLSLGIIKLLFQTQQKLCWQIVKLGFGIDDQQSDHPLSQLVEIHHPGPTAFAHACARPAHLAQATRAGNHIPHQRIGRQPQLELHQLSLTPYGSRITLKSGGFNNGVHRAKYTSQTYVFAN
jgi:hypothetical protein